MPVPADNQQDQFPSLSSKRYEDFSLLGSGGMGTVFKARDTVLNKHVALKFLSGETWSQEKVVRFQREAQALAKLNHHNIAQIYDFGLDDNSIPYMVLELVDGVDLASLKPHENFSAIEILEIAHQICAGLAHAHERGIVHRDIKPGNILVNSSSRQAKLVDFGIAKFIDSLSDSKTITAQGVIIGSPLFMSPEQVKNEEITEKADIYSLGCVLFYMLTGRAPFCSEKALEITRMHTEVAPPPLDSACGKNYPLFLQTIIWKCMEKVASSRYESISELQKDIGGSIEALHEIEQEQGNATTSDTTDRRAKVGSRLTKESAYIAALCAIVIAAVGSAFYQIANQEKQPAPRTGGGFDFIPTSTPGVQVRTESGITVARIKNAREEEWSELSKRRGVEKLFIYASIVPNRFFKNFGSAPAIKLVSFNECPKINDEALSELQGYGRLDQIEFKDCPFTKDTVESLKKLRFFHLSIRGCKLEDPSILNELTYLKILSLDENETNDEGVGSLTKLVNLSLLSVNNSALTGKGLAKLAGKVPLETLDMQRCPNLKAQDLDSLAKFPRLVGLEINENNISRALMSKVSKIENLAILNLTGCRIDDDAYEVIGQCSKLVNLSLKATGATDENLARILKLKELTKLNLTGTQASLSMKRQLKKHCPKVQIEDG